MIERGPIVLESSQLVVEYKTSEGRVRSLDSATLTVRSGDVLAVVGESGSGKSTLGMAAGGLLAANARHVSGTLRVAGVEPLDCTPSELRDLRRDSLGFIFQNPVTALDPTMRIQRQMTLAASRRGIALDVHKALLEVGLRDVDRILASFPHELSGGMAQRVGIAMALSRRPRVLIADEATAAVDATGRELLLKILVERCRAEGCALILLTHDLHAVAKVASRVAVMYGGRVVETGSTDEVFGSSRHPYSRALLGALPGDEAPGERLEAIRGVPPVLRGASPGCAFAARCPVVLDICGTARPAEVELSDRPDGISTCHRNDKKHAAAIWVSPPSSKALAANSGPAWGVDHAQ